MMEKTTRTHAQHELMIYVRQSRLLPGNESAFEAAHASAWICVVADIITLQTYRRILDLLKCYRWPKS